MAGDARRRPPAGAVCSPLACKVAWCSLGVRGTRAHTAHHAAYVRAPTTARRPAGRTHLRTQGSRSPRAPRSPHRTRGPAAEDKPPWQPEREEADSRWKRVPKLHATTQGVQSGAPLAASQSPFPYGPSRRCSRASLAPPSGQSDGIATLEAASRRTFARWPQPRAYAGSGRCVPTPTHSAHAPGCARPAWTAVQDAMIPGWAGKATNGASTTAADALPARPVCTRCAAKSGVRDPRGQKVVQLKAGVGECPQRHQSELSTRHQH